MNRKLKYKAAQLVKSKTGWYVWFEVEDPDTGLMVQYVRKSGINLIANLDERHEAAYALIQAIDELLEKGITPLGIYSDTELSNKTLRESFDFIVSQKKKTVRKDSYRTYFSSAKTFYEFLKHANLIYIMPEDFTKAHAQAFYGWSLNHKKWSGKTFNGIRLNISMLFNELVSNEIIPKNPFHVLKKRPENTQKNLAYNREERKLLREYFTENNPLLGEFCQCLYYLGIRRKELLDVRLRDVSLEHMRFMIFTGSAKNRRQEGVYMSESMRAMILAKNLDQYPQDYFLFGKDLKICDKPWAPTRVSEMHREVIVKLKLNPDHTLYSWKHTGACEFYLNNGKDIIKLMKHLRHADVQTTMKYVRSLGLDYDKDIQLPAF